jgi:hypothetical protein
MKDVVDIGSRLELFVDDWLVDRMDGATLTLHPPTPQGVALVYDRPWEGNTSNYVTVFKDGDLYRMYYRGSQVDHTPGEMTNRHRVVCYAESTDGVRWERPSLGLVEFEGSKDNNIIWDGSGSATFAPFKDANPDCDPEARYKALGAHEGGLLAFRSPDGIHWSMMTTEKVITDGAFDSQNLAFWDSVRGEYREYHRDFHEGVDAWGNSNGRDIKTATTNDFLEWPDPDWLNYSPGRIGQLYTNQVVPYYRAPHIFLGFPTRYTDRGWAESTKALPQLEYREVRASKSQREGTAMTDGMFMSSRDGLNFNVWPEAFIRPGLKLKENWFYGDNYQNHGLVETASHIEGAADEISVYSSEATHLDYSVSRLRRYTLRIDGFVSVQGKLAGGEFVTRPLVFKGGDLVLNFSGSAGSTIRVEVQNALGYALPGFAMEQCHEVFGDDLERVVSWQGDGDLSGLAGTPVRLRVELRDADLYSLRFR